jgi:hypothetical protein
MGEMPAVTVNAYDLARTWLAVAIAQSDDSSRPALYRSTLVEWYPAGLRFVSTDSYVLFRGWLPFDGKAREPALSRQPIGSVIVTDPDKRALNLLGFLRGETKGEPEGKAEPIPVTLATTDTDLDDQGSLDGLSPTYFTIHTPYERLVLPTFDGSFPTWRQLFTAHKPAPTDTLGVGPMGVLRLGQLSKLFGHVPLRLEFAGPHHPVLVYLDNADAHVTGLAMPVRDANAPTEPTEPYPGAVQLAAAIVDTLDGQTITFDEDPVGVIEITRAPKVRRRKAPKP